ncbi:MAG: ABC transporter permease [Planctomycetota bacterium]|nr:ABC transporter permease [Planctomycetota bacterium]
MPWRSALNSTLKWLFRSALPPTVTFIVINLLWEASIHVFKVPRILVPKPSEVYLALWHEPEALLRGTFSTGVTALLGFGLSAVIGVAAGVVLSSSRWIERAFYPFTVFLQTVPLVAIAPLLVVWFEIGKKPVVVAAFIVSVFPVIVNTMTGLRSVDPALIDLFRLYGASPLSRLFKLRLPAALPNIFTGLRIAAGLAVIGTIVGELFASYADENAGIGMLVQSYQKEGDLDFAFAAVGLASLLGLLMFGSINLASYITLRRWHASEQGRAV